MKMMQVHPVTVGENTFYIRPLPAFTAARLSAELGALAAPLLSGLAPILAAVDSTKEGNGLFDVDVEQAAPAIAGAFSTLSGDRFEALLKHLLIEGGNISVELPDSDKPQKLTQDLVNEVFCEDVQDMFILAFHVIRLNYNGFFKKLGAQFGPLADKVKALTTPTQQNTGTSTSAASAN